MLVSFLRILVTDFIIDHRSPGTIWVELFPSIEEANLKTAADLNAWIFSTAWRQLLGMRKLIFCAKARKVPFEIMLHFSVSTGQAAVQSTAKNRDPVKNTVPETTIKMSGFSMAILVYRGFLSIYFGNPMATASFGRLLISSPWHVAKQMGFSKDLAVSCWVSRNMLTISRIIPQHEGNVGANVTHRNATALW